MRKYDGNAGFGDWETLWGRFPFGEMSERLAGTNDTGVSLEREEEGYVVFADIPGFEREDLDLRYEDGALTITGTHEMETDDEVGRTSRNRRVHERVRVPGEVRTDDIAATLKNGVLEVRLPLAAESEDGHRIDVE